MLVACERRVIQDLILRELSSEFDDLLIVRATGVDKFFELSETYTLDAVFCDIAMISDALQGYLEALETTKLYFRCSAGVALPAEFSSEQSQVLSLDDGWAAEVFGVLRRDCDPKKHRTEERYHIPGLEAHLEMDDVRIGSVVINMNSSGVLLEMDYRPENAKLLNGVDLTLVFSGCYPYTKVQSIRSRIIRINVLEADRRGLPSKIRVVALFLGATREHHLQINENLQFAHAEEQRLSESL